MTERQAKAAIVGQWNLQLSADATGCYGHMNANGCIEHNCPLKKMCFKATACHADADYPFRLEHRRLLAVRMELSSLGYEH